MEEPDGGLELCGSDTECDDGLFCNGAERCDPDDSAADADGCVDGMDPCAGTCDEDADECAAGCADFDGDGVQDVACGGADCDDSDPNRFPGNTEVCDEDGHDEDCNPMTYGSVDADEDGIDDAACCNTDAVGVPTCGRDCDDSAAGVSPLAPEVCNEVDDDCDGLTDEGVLVTLWPDADEDGYGTDDEEASSINGCPGTAAYATARGDCDDVDSARSPGVTEACNGIDDDCDDVVDDILDGSVVCTSGQTMACDTTCGVGGQRTCDACLAWGPCVAAEVCNGCDDDGDGDDDEDFTCTLDAVETCTTACGTPGGSRTCVGGCEWGACRAAEACNWCDDDGNDGFRDERTLATSSRDWVLRDPATMPCDTYGDATCGMDSGGSVDFYLAATLIDGSSNDEAGAIWLDPGDLFSTWGTTTIIVEVRARTRPPAGTDVALPLGGWALALASPGAATGVGPGNRLGVPNDSMPSVRWRWAGNNDCGDPATNYPPGDGDVVSYWARGSRRYADAGDECFAGESVGNGAVHLNVADTTFVTQRLTIEYTAEDPETGALEEQIVIRQGTDTWTYQAADIFGTGTNPPTNDLPVGSPFVIGVTAGTWTEGGFDFVSGVHGMPVEAKVRIWSQSDGGTPMGATFDPELLVSQTLACPE